MSAQGPSGYPEPPSEGLAGEYFSWHAVGEFRLQRCRVCRRWLHPPNVCCPDCASFELDWEIASGRGHVYTWTVTHYPFHPAFAGDIPYVTAVVETDEGPRVLSSLFGFSSSKLTMGLPVQATFITLPSGKRIVSFEEAEYIE